MAIYRLNLNPITRANGHSSVGASAYRHASCLIDERTGVVHDYTKKSGAIYNEMSFPENMPSWAKEIESLFQEDLNTAASKLWNIVEVREKLADSELSRECQIALPIELDAFQNIELLREFIQESFSSRGIISDWAIHFDIGNPHAHIMNTTRSLEENGFGNKVVPWKQKAFLYSIRKEWADKANKHLQRHGIDARIDHRSYADQNIDLIPTQHMGKRITELERRGIKTDRLAEQRAIQRQNLEKIKNNPAILFDAISKETLSGTFTDERVVQVLSRYINPHDEQFSVFKKELLAERAHAQAQHFESAHSDALVIEAAVLKQLIQEDSREKFVNHSVEKAVDNRPTSLEKILEKITHHESVFSEKDIAIAVNHVTPNAELFAQALMSVKAEIHTNKNILPLGLGDDGRQKFTTRELFNKENACIDIAESLSQTHHALITASQRKKGRRLREKETGKQFKDEQLNAIEHMTSSKQISCLVGRAGTGKSFTVGAVREIYEAQGFNVQGIALSAVAANGLRKDAGIEARTIASLKASMEQMGKTLCANDFIIMDEAGMTDLDSMFFILQEVQKSGAKLILMGDPDQLQPVGPGAIFRALLERLENHAEIREIYRQKETWQKQATIQFAEGATMDALNAYETQGCIHLEKTEIDAMNLLVADWRTCFLENKDLTQQIVIAHENKDVAALNKALRQVLVDIGHLQKEGYTLELDKGQTLSIVTGERLVFLKNDSRLSVSNGSFGTVTGVSVLESGKVKRFTVRLDGQEKDITLQAGQYKDIDYGYASTVHKSQGATKSHAFVYVAGNLWDKAMSYVAMTRHTLTANLYAARSQFPTLSDLYQSLGQLARKDSVLNYPLNFARRRGIEPDAKGFASHVAKTLRNVKTTLQDNYQRVVTPTTYNKRLAKEAEQAARDDKRQAAVIVAEYKDVSIEAGKLWRDTLAQLKTQGITEKSEDFFESLKAMLAYQQREALIAQRDALAAQIYPNREYNALAIELNRIDVKKMSQQALTHAVREELNAYQAALEQNNHLIAQKIAHELSPKVKVYYALMKSMNVDTNALNSASKAYELRTLKRSFTVDERAAFKRVEAYMAVLRQSGPLLSQLSDLYHAEKHPEICVTLQEKLTQLGKQKASLAAGILKDRDVHGKALDYFEIGKGTDLVRAQKCWYQLQQAASFHGFQQKKSIAVEHAPIATNQQICIEPMKGRSKLYTHSIDLARLKADLNAQVESVALHYLGEPIKRKSGQWQYGTNKGSQFVTINGPKQGQWYDFQTGMGGDMLSLIGQQTGGDFKTTLFEAVDFLGGASHYQKDFVQTPEQIALREKKSLEALRIAAAEQAKKQAHVQDISKGTQAVQGTLAERYLREHRAINQELNSDNLRFHPALKNWSNGQTYPALVVLAHNEKNELVGLQATFLDPVTANKAHIEKGNNKLSRGLISQGATVHQTITDNPNPTVALAEGLETALSVATAHPDWDVKLTFGVSNFEKVAMASSKQEIVICTDNDGLESGTAKSVKKAVDNLAIKGITAHVVEPTKPEGAEKWDFNDTLKKEGVTAVRADLDRNISEKERNNSSEFTEEQIYKYDTILNKLHRLQKESQTPETINLHAFKMAELPKLMRYIEKQHPKEVDPIREKAKKHIQKKFNLPTEKIMQFDTIIKKYETLQSAQEKNTGNLPKTRAALENHAFKMSALPTLMKYIEHLYPQHQKNIGQLSRSHEKNQSQDIDR